MKRGKVYIVGAGPGHPELLTLKAADLLRTADVVVYDRLVQEEVLSLAKPSAERLYMGKAVGKHESRQDEIHKILERKAREGKRVVRLKGGDPFVFGRGGEEAEYLAARGVPFEVIPGVTSALAAPLSAGIAVTHRRNASCVTIVTGHEAKDEETRIDWSALARLDTLVFLMGVKNAGRIAERLIKHGRSPDTPVAVIQMAFWSGEQVLETELGRLGDDIEEAGIAPPASIVVGDAVRLRSALAGSDRDLKRREDATSRFEPAPVPDQLLRLATAGVGAQVVGLCLEKLIFDETERPLSAVELSAGHGFDPDATLELMEALLSLGLVEKRDGRFSNLELASRYLCSVSPESLRFTILEKLSQSVSWRELERYVVNGCLAFRDPRNDALHSESCESLAGYGAPAVLDRIKRRDAESVFLLGWGEGAYAKKLAELHPSASYGAVNPFLPGEENPGAQNSLPDGSFNTIILSGLLSSSDAGEVEASLTEAGKHLKKDGLLAVCDSFLPIGVLPPPEMVLGALARRVSHGGCRSWSVERLGDVLRRLGFEGIKTEALSAGMVLVTARLA